MPQDLELAMASFSRKEYSLNKCSRVYNIPKAILKRHMDSKNKIANAEIKFQGWSYHIFK